MRGYKVERRFGWDTHGLPAELEVERQLGITDKSQIDDMGIAAFNDACRESVLRYTDEWQAYVTRQARWVDFDNDYKTLDLSYMESVIWAFKQLWDKGLAYEGYRVLPYCWRDETPLSNHELRMDDDVYQSRQDPALTVGFKVVGGDAGRRLPAGVDDDTVDPAVEPRGRRQPGGDLRRRSGSGDRRFVLAEARLAAYARELGEEPEILGTYRGADLLGTRYLPPFPYFMDSPKAFQVLPGDFVTTEDGTGIVHMAPAYGEDDMATTDKVGIVPVTPVDSKGRFDATVPDYQGQHVFDANAADHPRPEEPERPGGGERRGVAPPRNLRAPLPALLAVPQSADLSGGVVVVRHGHRIPRPHGGTQPADHLVSRTRQGRPVRQVAAGRPRLVDLAKPLLGHSDSGMEVRRPGLPAHRRLRQPRRAGARLRGAAHQFAPALHRRADPAQPRRPHRPQHHAADPRRARRVVRLGLHAVRPGALSVRERATGSTATIPATSSSSTSGRPAAGSTRCTCWPPRCSTGRRSKPVWRMGLCWAPTARR